MLYIRNMKMQPHYNPNLRHVIYGLDADLIMLSLVAHEPHFALLREEVIFGSPQKQGGKPARKQLKKYDEFQYLHVSLLRQYLDLEYRAALKESLTEFEYDMERIIDDFIFLAILVGNDFLPHLPTIDIGEGGLDTLYSVYKRVLPELGGYVVDGGDMNVHRLQRILQELATLEADVFQQRTLNTEKEERRHKHQRQPITEIDAEDWFSEDEQIVDSGDESEPDALTYKQAILQQQVNDTSLVEQHKKQYYTEKFPEFYGMISAHTAAQHTSTGTQSSHYLSPHTLHHTPAVMSPSPSPSPSPQPFTRPHNSNTRRWQIVHAS